MVPHIIKILKIRHGLQLVTITLSSCYFTHNSKQEEILLLPTSSVIIVAISEFRRKKANYLLRCFINYKNTLKKVLLNCQKSSPNFLNLKRVLEISRWLGQI